MSEKVGERTGNYRLYHDSVMRLHELYLEGKNNSAEAEALRRETDETWFELSEEEQETLDGLSADLVDVEEIRTEPIAKEPPGQLANKLQQAIKAYDNGESDRALAWLRECKKVPPFSRISYFRGRIWAQKGEFKTAAIFLKHAVDLAPTNALYWAAWMDALRTADPKTACEIADGSLSDYENSSPFVVINACQLKFESTLELDDEAQALPIYEQIVQALDSANKKLFDANKPLWEFQPFFGLSFSLLATCLEHIGKLPYAYYCYTWAIGLGPNAALLTARGKMMYGLVSQISQSIIDFRDAIKLGTDLAVPYFFLAHYAIATGDFEEALTMATEGLRRKWTKRMMSELYEFKAIADYHLLANQAKVRKSFQDAIRTDVTNERAAKNLAKFEELIQKNERPAEQPWALPKVDDVKRLARDVQFAARNLVES